MTHHGPSVQNLGTKLPPFELNARQRDFISDALYEAGVSRLQRDGICLTLAALHNIRPDQRSSGRPDGDGWKLVSIYGLAQRRDLSERAIRRHITSMAKAGLIDKGDHLGPRAGIWVRYDSLSEILPPPKGVTSSTKSSTKSSDHFQAGTGISPPSINSGNNNKNPLLLKSKPAGDSIKQIPAAHQLPQELLPHADLAFKTLQANGMYRNRPSFDRVIASAPPEFTTGQIRQALINLQNTTLQTITPDLWIKQLKATLSTGPVLQPYVREKPGPEPQWLIDRQAQWDRDWQERAKKNALALDPVL